MNRRRPIRVKSSRLIADYKATQNTTAYEDKTIVQNNMPTRYELFVPIIKALQELGGSGSVTEINNKVYGIAKISDEILQVRHGTKGTTSEIDYRLAWSRTYLKEFGFINNSSRGVWALSKFDIDVAALELIAQGGSTKTKKKQSISENYVPVIDDYIENEITEEVDSFENWKDELLDILYSITPAAFERLSQQILRESGFFQVEVTGKVGDGGIDGRGIARVNGLLSFPVIFQCKRYRGSVSPSQVRDFRGAMQGRADKGLIITTGKFTRDAIKEATRDGVPLIDLIDGETLCDKLKELKLGVDTKLTETVCIKNEWFNSL